MRSPHLDFLKDEHRERALDVASRARLDEAALFAMRKLKTWGELPCFRQAGSSDGSEPSEWAFRGGFRAPSFAHGCSREYPPVPVRVEPK